jgi:hypothetical protein
MLYVRHILYEHICIWIATENIVKEIYEQRNMSWMGKFPYILSKKAVGWIILLHNTTLMAGFLDNKSTLDANSRVV